MAIATDIEVNWYGTVDNTNKIGLSKTLNQLAVNIFDDADYLVGFTNKALKLVKESDSYPHSISPDANDVAFYIDPNSGQGYTLNGMNYPDGVYYRTLLFAAPSGWSWGWDSNLRSNNTDLRIITKLDLSKNKAYFNTESTTKSDRIDTGTITVKESLEGTSSTGTFDVNNVNYYIVCGDVYKTDNGYYIKFPHYIDNLYDNWNATYGEGAAANFNYDTNSIKMFSASPAVFANNLWYIRIDSSGNPDTYDLNTWVNHELEVAPDADNEDIKLFGSYFIYSPYYWRIGYTMSIEYWLYTCACYGMFFEWNGTALKPIIENGEVKGYTDDMSIPSDIDNWTDITGHNISPTPPVPPAPTGDNIDDMNMNSLWAMSSDAGFARYFLLSHNQLASLMTWLSDTTFPDGYDPYAYILSLLQFPLKLSPSWCMPRTPAGHIVIGGEDTGITASLIANEKSWVGAGTYDVPELNGNFLDYDPYTQYELYIPCCGWVSLPDIVCGRKIAVKINYDLTTASIIGNVYVEIDGKQMIVASKSGMMGRETIVTGEAQGVRSAQITSALLSAGTGALNVATGAMSGNAVAAVSGGYNIVAGLAQANIAANSAYTRTIGSTGGRALLCQFDQCYLKICTTRADIPLNYGHTCGYVCNVSGKVSDFTGYTVFDNVDVSGIGKATDREKKLIKQILESGVIINPSEE
ncbi:MAG: hypothetical protein J6U97_04645 [Bacteroidaceae bacterium]|nr:hypothetical protein [Bacteroidaceae bacterium]